MSAHHDTPPPPGRPHLVTAHDEPPFDPDYDTPRTTSDTPAQDMAAEQSVLGAMIVDPTTIPDVTQILSHSDFYRPSHEQIFGQLVEMQATDEPIDPITLVARLDRAKILDKVGGPLYIHTLTNVVPIAANATSYATVVRDKARRRTVHAAGTKLIQISRTGDNEDLDTVFDLTYETIDQAAARVGTTTTPAAAGLVDLTWILTGQPPVIPPPTYGTRTDGHALFYAAKINGLFGDPETAKTWLAQTAMVDHLNNGGTAAMIDVDHNGPDHTAARLLLLGAHPRVIADQTRFRYYEPDDGDQLRAAVHQLTHTPADIVLVDSLGEILPMLGVNGNDGDEVTNAIRTTCVPIADTGTCVITIDHLPKSTDARATGYAIGSIAKKRMMRGSYIRCEEITKPAPGQIGRIGLRIEKDTSGELRKNSRGGYAGTFILDSTNPAITTTRIELESMPTNDDGTIRPTRLMEQISRHIEQNDQATFRDIKENVVGKDKWLRMALHLLITEGFVTVRHGARNSQHHHAVALYREAEDDHLN